VAQTKLQDLLTAIDQYMAQTANNANNGPYIASKLSGLFDDPKSPLNIKSGPLKDIKHSIDNFGSKIDDTSKAYGVLGNLRNIVTLLQNNNNRNNNNQNNNNNNNGLTNTTTRFNNIIIAKLTEISTKLSKPLVSNVNINGTGKVDKEKKSILDTIIGWVKPILFFIGGIFLIGKLNKFLNTTIIGNTIKEKTKLLFNKIFDTASAYVKSGDIGATFKESFKGIKNFISSVFHVTKRFVEKNQDAIVSTMKTILTSLWEEIIKPLGGFVMDYIITPLFDNIKNDFSNGDFTSGTLKTVGVLFATSLIPGISSLILTALNPWGAALIGFTASIAYAKDAIDQYNKAKAEYDKMTLENLRHEAKSKDMFSKQLDDLNKKMDSTSDIKEKSKILIDAKIAEANMKMSGDLKDIDKKIATKSTLRKFADLALNYHTFGLYSVEKEEQKKRLEITKKYGNEIENLLKNKDAISSEYERNALDNRQKLIKEFVFPKIESDTVSKPIQDGIVIEPHSKDQIIAGKLNGPFDLAMKDGIALQKEQIDILKEGITALISSVIQSGNGIISAVGKSSSNANVASTSKTSYGGNDHIKDHRTRVAIAIG
jgi:hypothetical protein